MPFLKSALYHHDSHKKKEKFPLQISEFRAPRPSPLSVSPSPFRAAFARPRLSASCAGPLRFAAFAATRGRRV